jgi:hypothetical protein
VIVRRPKVKYTGSFSGAGGWTSPSWRVGLTLGTVNAIPNTSFAYSQTAPGGGMVLTALGEESLSSNINVHGDAWGWGSFAASTTTLYAMANGGEAQYFNPSAAINLNADAPRWTCLQRSIGRTGTNGDEFVNAAHMSNGSPCGRHTYDSQHYVGPGLMADGKARVIMFTYHAGSAPYTPALSGAAGGGVIDGWRVSDGAWDAAGTWPDTTSLPLTGLAPSYNVPCKWTAQCDNPATGDIYGIGETTGTFQRALVKWTAATGALSYTVTTPNYPTAGYSTTALGYPDAVGYPGTFDTLNNSFVYIYNSNLQKTNVTTGVTTNVMMNASLYMYDGALCYDPDNNRFIAAPSGASVDGNSPVYAVTQAGAVTLLGVYPSAVVTADHITSRMKYLSALGGVALMAEFTSANIHFIPTRAAP